MAELPMIEKYRPESLEDLAGDGNARALKAFVKTGQFPLAMIFHGIYGTGKTTAARALVRDYYVTNGLYLPTATFRDIRSGNKTAPGFEGLFPPVLYVDATITRDIDFIKNTIQQFMKTVAPMHLKKFIIIDEGDRLSRDAQGALRSLLEKYPNTVTVWTTNSLHNIDEAIQDRASGAVLEFLKPSVEDVVLYLKKLAAKEYAEIPDEKLRQISVESESLRQAVGRLGTEVAIFRAEHAKPRAPEITTIPSAVEEKPIPELENPPEETVYVKIEVEGGVEAKEDGKPKIETPEFLLMATTYEEFAKHGNTWAEDMWSRPLVGMFGVSMLGDVLKEAELEYNAAEDNMLTWGNDPDSIKEALSQNPAPFNHIAVFTVKWRTDDITWTESAKQAYDIFHFKYTREALEKLSKENIRLIAKIKDVSSGKDEAETIGNIIAHDAYAEEIVTGEVKPSPEPGERLPVTPEHEHEFYVGDLARHFKSNETKKIIKAQWDPKDRRWWYQFEGEDRMWNEMAVRSPPKGRTVWIYNPTYGSLQEKSLETTLPESEVWTQSEVSEERALKDSEKKVLLEKGVFDAYPEEWYLVPGPAVPGVTLEEIRLHARQVERLDSVDQEGEPFNWKDTLGNQEEKIKLHFVRGPYVDIINNNEDPQAVKAVYEGILNQASSKFKKMKSFQEAAERHARKLVQAVRSVVPFPQFRLKFSWAREEEKKKKEEEDLEELVEEAVGELEGVGESALKDLEGL